VRLIDVGYGALFDASADVALSTTNEDQPAGVASPLYSAPERFKIAADGCGKPSDVFSFGKLLYHLITGEQPFVIKPVSLKFRALGATWDDSSSSASRRSPRTGSPTARRRWPSTAGSSAPRSRRGSTGPSAPSARPPSRFPAAGPANDTTAAAAAAGSKSSSTTTPRATRRRRC
jgi:hypothetical protein